MNSAVHSFNAKLPLATHFQLNGDVFPVCEDDDAQATSCVEPEHDDKQPVLSSPQCAVVITAGMVRGARLENGGLILASGQTLAFLAPF